MIPIYLLACFQTARWARAGTNWWELIWSHGSLSVFKLLSHQSLNNLLIQHTNLFCSWDSLKIIYYGLQKQWYVNFLKLITLWLKNKFIARVSSKLLWIYYCSIFIKISIFKLVWPLCIITYLINFQREIYTPADARNTLWEVTIYQYLIY